MKRFSGVLLASILCGPVVSAHADTMYTYYLIDGTGVQDGYVQFTISAPPPATGALGCSYDYPVNCKLETLNTYLGPPGSSSLTLGEESGYSSVHFNDGVLAGIQYSYFTGVSGYGPNTTFNLLGLTYDETYFNAFVPPYEQTLLQGTISATAAATVTPEPWSLALCGTGLLAGAGAFCRRHARWAK